MTEFKVIKPFRDIHTGEVYQAGQVIKISIKRSKEVIANLGGGFLERLEEGD